MRLPGRMAAAMEVLEEILERHRPAADALQDWGRSHRFAGSGDRAAIGNLVYDALRHRASYVWRMGGEAPRALVLATAVIEWELPPDALTSAFSGDAHAPAAIDDEERRRLEVDGLANAPAHVRADVPEWLQPSLERGLGGNWIEECVALAGRPPLDLRVNTLKTTRDKAAKALSRLGAEATTLSSFGLRVPATRSAERHPNVQTDETYRRGRVEVQDEGSQIVASLVGAQPGDQVLDFCAGAGGKTLALAAMMENRGQIHAHDADRTRLAPIYDRLKRAGVRNVQVQGPTAELADLEGRMDRVVVDAPCSGSGTWRRRPDAKWRLKDKALERRMGEQDAILSQAARYVRRGGNLAYITCSVLPQENEERVDAFLAGTDGFVLVPGEEQWRERIGRGEPRVSMDGGALGLSPAATGTDGFFFAMLRRID